MDDGRINHRELGGILVFLVSLWFRSPSSRITHHVSSFTSQSREFCDEGNWSEEKHGVGRQGEEEGKGAGRRC